MSPAIVLFVAFTYAPFIRAIFLSFFTVNRNTFQPARFVSLDYYKRILDIGGSPFGAIYLHSLLTSVEFALMVVPPSLVAALALAVLAQAKLKRIGLFRSVFTSPIAISIASAGAASAVLGFSQAASGVAPATAPATAVEALPQPAGSTKVTFWFGLTGVNGDVVRKVVNKYNASQSKYYVEAISQPDYDATINKLNTSLAGGELPNVVQIYDIGTQRMIDTKKIVPVQNLIDKEKLGLIKDLEPAVASYYTIAGTLYSMPFNSSAPVMYFDKAAFKAAGLDTSKRIWTYDEVAAAAKALTKRDVEGKVTRHGIGFSLYSWILEEELATQGAIFADPGNGRQSRAQKLVFNSKAGENWLNFLKSTVDSGSGESFGIDGGANSAARDAAFVIGEACITFNSIASLRGYIKGAKDSGKGVDVGVVYIPRPTGAPGGVIIGGASLWITNTGKPEEQAGAWDFVKFASSAPIQAFFSSNTGYYPPHKAAYAEKDMRDALALYPQFQVAIDELRATRANSATQGAVFGTFVKARSNIQGAMEQFVTGKIPSAKQALDGAASRTLTRTIVRIVLGAVAATAAAQNVAEREALSVGDFSGRYTATHSIPSQSLPAPSPISPFWAEVDEPGHLSNGQQQEAHVVLLGRRRGGGGRRSGGSPMRVEGGG